MKIIAYVNNPEQLSETADVIGNTWRRGVMVSVHKIIMYQKMKFSIMQIKERVTKLVFGLTVMTSICGRMLFVYVDEKPQSGNCGIRKS